MSDKKITELPIQTSLTSDDLILIVNDPSGIPTTSTVSAQTFFSNVSSISMQHVNVKDFRTPNSSTDTCVKGDMFFDTSYLYVATANSILKRIALQTF